MQITCKFSDTCAVADGHNPKFGVETASNKRIPVSSIRILSGAKRVISGGKDGAVKVWDVAEGMLCESCSVCLIVG